MSALHESRMNESFDAAAGHVQKYFGKSGEEHEIHRAITLGESHGIDSKRDLLRLINLVMCFGTGFPDEFPWAKGVLDVAGISSSSKVEMLVRAATVTLERALKADSTATAEVVTTPAPETVPELELAVHG